MPTEQPRHAPLAEALVTQEPWDAAASAQRLERAQAVLARQLSPAQRDAWRTVAVAGLLPLGYLLAVLLLSLLRRNAAPAPVLGGDRLDHSLLALAGPDSFETVGVVLTVAGCAALVVLRRGRAFLAGLERGLAFIAVVCCWLVFWRQADSGMLLVSELIEAIVKSLAPGALAWFVLGVIDRTRRQLDDLTLRSLQQELTLADLRAQVARVESDRGADG